MALLLMGAAVQDYLRVRSITRELAERQAAGQLRMIELAMNQAALAERSVLTAVHDHLFSVAYRVVDEGGNINDPSLTRVASESGVAWIRIVDAAGQIIDGSGTGVISKDDTPLLTPLSQAEQIVGFIPDETGRPRHYAVAVGYAADRWVLVGLDAEEILALRGEVGLGAILAELGYLSDVRFAALVSESSILAATPNPPSWLEGPDDLGFASEGSARDTLGFVSTPEGMLFEIRSPAPGYNNVDLRLGVDASSLEEIRRTSFITLIIRSVLFIALIGLTTVVLLSRYRTQVLMVERDAIREDVRRLEADQRRSERLVAMGELAAGVAHEIRNPLNSISMAAQRLRSEYAPQTDTQGFTQLVAALSNETARIGRIIDSFLRFARPPLLQRHEQELSITLAPILTLIEGQAGPRGVVFTASLSPGNSLYHDPDQLSQVVLNLLLNALEAVDDETGQIALQVIGNHDEVRIKVEDNGHGIPKAVRDRIFDLYVTTKPDGTGFGLAQVQQVVSEHGGSVRVDDRLEGGTTFSISLPVRNM